MQMDGWRDHLHISLLGEHVLFPGLRLDSLWNFIVAAVLTVFICLLERALTYGISKNWHPCAWTRRSRVRRAAWKTSMYWVVTFARLMYMLIAMTFSLGLIFVTVTTLSFGQFLIELAGDEDHHIDKRQSDPESMKEPLLSDSPTYASYEPSLPLHSYPHSHTRDSNSTSTLPSYSPRRSSSSSSVYGYAGQTEPLVADMHESAPEQTEPQTEAQRVATRPRSRSKPSKIFIHPADSNLARADAAALQLGIGGDTELVKGIQCPSTGETAWKTGKGRLVAHQLMGSRSTLS